MKKKSTFIHFLNKKVLLLILILYFGIFSCGRERGKEVGSEKNLPPVITSLRIYPENPTKENELTLVIQSQDPDKDPVSYSYQWFKNGEEIPGENKNSLTTGNFKKGDLIQVRVTPSDGKVNGNPFLSEPVKILNSPPIIQELWIEPKVAYANNDLKVYVKSIDKDGDFIYYTYQWEKNGNPIPEERKEILGKGNFKKGDSITVTVIPDDRESSGKPKKSDPLIISNHAPIIVSSPPTSIEKNIYIYQVKVEEPDGDAVQFRLKSGPKGMEIDKNTGLIRWEIRKEDQGTHLIEIEALDSEGARSTQRYTLTVEIK
ncbi:MAG: Ig domain-containing protein [Thermodesulfobacteriota bacterium]